MTADAPDAALSESPPHPLPRERWLPWRELLPPMFRVGLESFGGPVAQLGVMHRVAVEERKWLSDTAFVHLVNFANVLPGPEALEVAIHLGYLKRGLRGGIASGLLFVWPGFVSLTLLAWLYVAHGDLAWMAGAIEGLRWVAVGLIASAAVRLGTKTLAGVATFIAAASMVAILLDVPFPLVLAGAALLGYLLRRRKVAPAKDAQRSMTWIVLALLVAGGLWALPSDLNRAPRRLAAQAHVVPRVSPERLVDVAIVNTKLAMLTFGGAYASLPYLRQQAVVERGWIRDDEMLDALALAETTPGPLMCVGVFVSYLAAGPWGAVVGCFFLFLPSFVLVLSLGRFIHRVERWPLAGPLLWGISAGTLGMTLALSSRVAASTLDAPRALAVAIAAFVATTRYKANTIAVVAAGALAGVLRAFAG